MITFPGLVLITALAAGPKAAPNPEWTPGEINPLHRLELLCKGGNKYYPRKVTQAIKAKVAALYGVRRKDWRHFEFDHLIPHCAGGADTVKNLWPQPLVEAKIKDHFEEQYCRDMCQGKRTQAEVAEFFQSGGWH